jgi:hypothetical protein
VTVGGGTGVSVGVADGGSVSVGIGVQVGVSVTVGGKGVVVGMKAAMTAGAFSRNAPQPTASNTATTAAVAQKIRFDRRSCTVDSTYGEAGPENPDGPVASTGTSRDGTDPAGELAVPAGEVDRSATASGRGRPHMMHLSAPCTTRLSQRGQR